MICKIACFIDKLSISSCDWLLGLWVKGENGNEHN